MIIVFCMDSLEEGRSNFLLMERLPLDIKRKPEKKKKTGENESENLEKESNWLSFSKELRHFLPQIA